MITFDQAFLIGCGLAAIWALSKAFSDDRRLAEVGTARNFRVIIFRACVAGAVEVLLIGVLFWLIRTDVWGSRPLWFVLLLALGGAVLVTHKTWSDAWDAGERDWERHHGAHD
jgi:hypothetical protein